MRQLRMKFKTLFIRIKKYAHHFDLPLFFNMSKQFLALGVWVLRVFRLVSCKPRASRKLALKPRRPEKLQMF